MRPSLIRVRPAAIEANAARLAALAPGAALCAVVKAGGYGHGAATAATAALAGGASWLAVATAAEADELASAVAGGPPVLVLSELDPDDAAQAASTLPPSVRFTVATPAGVEALAARPGLAGPRPETEAPAARPGPAGRQPRPVHLKIDTGMHRMGAAPGDLAGVVAALSRAAAAGSVRLEGVWTHLAAADDPGDPFTATQLTRFDAALAELGRLGAFSGPGPFVTHAANSAGLLAHPRSHREMARVGIAAYGVAPAPALADRVRLEPALELVSRVTAVRSVAPGESVSYGRSWYAPGLVRVATAPIGYADGVRRDSGAAGVEVLIRGRRRRILGRVTMDQLMVAVGGEVAVGDEVVLIGAQGDERVTVDEVAGRLGTIAYEVLVGLGPRLPRIVK